MIDKSDGRRGPDGIQNATRPRDWRRDRRTRALLASEPKLKAVVSIAKKKLRAKQVWVFGSRATGTNRPDSDWDIFLVLPDQATDQDLNPVTAWSIGREAGLVADVVAERDAEVRAFFDVPNTLSYVLRREGVRVG
ncbi:nucleotidyltransferase domain-containing protein [Gluconacetobacter azotocaptans]|uniref:nucleotidyltransferase family protein n=1 Tax=Gluconacetobacter azotocaptans TaxID=142834 RepID=UPI0019574B12|nr:nucleotidyltransferase domain-containing protein [Gluconacetobacter azotocaptans]MBM9400808.1 nucleotidyltransferase domain-containing protein [Gluconacetobacter azotocaptans]